MAKDIKKVPAISVTCAREGFRRGGRTWGREVSVVKLSDLGKAQLKVIRDEKMLSVSDVEVEAEEAAAE